MCVNFVLHEQNRGSGVLHLVSRISSRYEDEFCSSYLARNRGSGILFFMNRIYSCCEDEFCSS